MALLVGDSTKTAYPDLYVTGYGPRRPLSQINAMHFPPERPTAKSAVADEGGWSSADGCDLTKDAGSSWSSTNYIECSKSYLWCGERRPLG